MTPTHAVRAALATFCALALGLGLLVAPDARADVPLYGTGQLTFTSAKAYDGAQGNPNPFTNIWLEATFTAPSGKQHVARGFFDGDGEGGMAGRVFRVRVFADEHGTWSWATRSNLPELDGRGNTFQCSGTITGRFAKGPIGVHPKFPRFLGHANGVPILLLGKFLDEAAPPRIQYSHTMLSEKRNDADRWQLLQRHKAMGLNKINIYIANRGDYDGVSTTPWLGTAANNDKRRFNLARWRQFDLWTLRLRNAGMLAHWWFFADDSGFGNIPPYEKRLLVEYGMARLSAYANTAFVLMLEWEEGWTPGMVHGHAKHLQAHNPWGRLVSVHGIPGLFAFPKAEWADHKTVQAGFGGGHKHVHALGVKQRNYAKKPILMEEFHLGAEEGVGRRKAWAAFMSGAAGIGNGAYLLGMAEFSHRVAFVRMFPAPQFVTAGSAYALAWPNQQYVFFLPDGGDVTVDLTGAAGAFETWWFNPRTYQWHTAAPTPGGALRSFSAPGQGDWALFLRRPAG